MLIDENTTLEAILENVPGAITVLAKHGLHSLSCPSEIYMPIQMVAQSRGIPIEHLIDDLRLACNALPKG